ncbi:hypothetical protein ABEB36_005359 [Hypothenemus hampei]|uniref:GA-binding protein subunit beta-1 n=1 Tax=Hypothenemus hampei TaxID=57062 RepID=A0ABD1F0J8_HYPHA
MIKFLDSSKHVKYILTQDNKLKPIVAVNQRPLNQTLQSINELGKHLLRAVCEGSVEDVKSFLNQGSPFTSDWLGTSPLHVAAQFNRIDICDILLKAGIARDARNKVDRTPLHLAAYHGHYQSAEILIKHGADLNCPDMLLMTPLHWAVQNGHTAVVELLVRNGAHTEVKNKFNLTPHDIAQQIKNLEIIELLLVAYETEPEPESPSMVMQLKGEDDSSHLIEVHEENVETNLKPIIIVDENQFKCPLEKPDSETLIFNLENNDISARYVSQAKKTQDPLIVNSTEEVSIEDFEFEHKKGDILNAGTKIEEKILSQSDDADNSFSAIELLQEHGITMLPNDNDDNNILNTVMENGHSVVLTDIGKEVLNTVKKEEEKQNRENCKMKRVITVTPEQFLSLTKGNFVYNNNTATQQNVKRVIMKRPRPTPLGNAIKVQCVSKPKNELEQLKAELTEAIKTIEAYKSKLRKKQIEAERYKSKLEKKQIEVDSYKDQLKLLMRSS